MTQARGGAVAALGLCFAFCLACIGYSLDRGLQLADESGYIYLLHHADVVIQYADHRLWPLLGEPLGGRVWTYRLLAGLLVQAATLTVALAARAVWRVEGGAAGSSLVLVSAIGACGYFTALRPTMNYATTAIVFGDLAVAALLVELARAPRRPSVALGLLAGGATALMMLGRFTAGPLVVGLACANALVRRDETPWRRAIVPGAALIGTLAMLAMLEACGFRLFATFQFGLALGGSTHDPATFLPRDLALGALVLGIGVAAASGTLAAAAVLGRDEAARLRWRSRLAAAFVVAVLIASVVDQRAVFGNSPGGMDPFANNRDLYGTTYGLWVLATYWPALLAIGRRRGVAREGPSARLWLLLFMLLVAAPLPFVGTNAGVLARSALNAGPLLIAMTVGVGEAVRCRLVGAAAAPAQSIGVGALTAAFVFLATIWSPAGVHGRAVEQTVRLDEPAALRGLRVSPAVARLAADARRGLATLGFDPTRDRLLFGYERPGLALLAGGEVAGPPWIYPVPAAQSQVCHDIVGDVRAFRPRRLYGLNLDYQPELARCLAAEGVDASHAPLRRFGAVVVTVVTPAPASSRGHPSPAPSPSVALPAHARR